MPAERWLPLKYELPDSTKLGRLLYNDRDWQIFRTSENNSVLIAQSSLADRWIEAGLILDKALQKFSFGENHFRALVSEVGKRLEPVAENKLPKSKTEGLSFAISLNETRKIAEIAPLHDAIYSERYSRLLPTWTLTEKITDEEVLGRWLTGGVLIPATAFRRLTSLLGCDSEDVCDLVEAAGFAISRESTGVQIKGKQQYRQQKSTGEKIVSQEEASGSESEKKSKPSQFRLAGRPTLEEFFNEHVVDIVENAERYKAFGINFPASIVLHGPPGCGKTFAIERLAEYLDWPVFSIDSNSVGSSYIHGTSKKIGKIFDQARDIAPSMIVIDEMESYLSDRQIQGPSGSSHVEEVAEFLRRIPEANENYTLVVGMTNKLELIDPAIIRRGRFDHIIEVGMPSSAEVSDLIDSLLEKMPIEGKPDTQEIVRVLTGRPMSDVTFVVREATRLAARAGKATLDQDFLQLALSSLPSEKPKKPSIGFIQN